MKKKTDVIIVGAGPTGVMLATLLGQKNISVILVEKERDVFPVTRATHLDVETLRNFQTTGLMDELKRYTESVTYFDVLDKNGEEKYNYPALSYCQRELGLLCKSHLEIPSHCRQVVLINLQNYLDSTFLSS